MEGTMTQIKFRSCSPIYFSRERRYTFDLKNLGKFVTNVGGWGVENKPIQNVGGWDNVKSIKIEMDMEPEETNDMLITNFIIDLKE